MRALHLVIAALMLATGATAASAQPSKGAPASPENPPRSIPDIFNSFCQAANGAAAYCPGGSIPDAIKWLVLLSECSGEAAEGKSYCADFERHKAKRPLILEYDHERGRWAALTFGNGADKPLESSDAWRVSGDINGVPTITRSRIPVPVIVSNTNPLLYGCSLEPTKLDDLEGLADLKAAVAGLGGLLQSWVTVLATKSATVPRRYPSLQAVDPVAEALKATRDILARLVNETWELDMNLDRAGADLNSLTERVAEFERRASRGVTFLPTVRRADAPGDLLASFQRVDNAFRDFTRFGGSCRPLLYAFVSLASQKAGPRGLAAAKQAYLALDHDIGPSCGVVAEKDPERTVQALRDHLRTLAENVDKDGLAEAQAAAASLPALLEGEGKEQKDAIARAAALLKKRDDADKIVTRLQVARSREQRFTLSDGRLLTWFYVERRSEQLPLDKLQTHGFTITADSVYAEAVAPTRSSGTKVEYRIKPQWSRGFGVSLGLTYTKLAEPSWDAVTPSQGGDRKEVAQTGSKTRAGQLALFADYNPAAPFLRRRSLPVAPIVQIGTAVSSNPGLFLGGGVQILNVARLTVGRTWQRMPELIDQQPGDAVGSKDDIRTRDHFAGATYFALVFALDSLPVFKKD